MKYLFGMAIAMCFYATAGNAQGAVAWDGGGANTLVKTVANWAGDTFPSVGDTGTIGGSFTVTYNNRADFDNRNWIFSGNSTLDGVNPAPNLRFKNGSLTFSDNAKFINRDVYEPDGVTQLTINTGALVKLAVRFSPRPGTTNNVVNILGGTFDLGERWDNTTGEGKVNISSGMLSAKGIGGFRAGYILEGNDRINFTGAKTGTVKFTGGDYSNNFQVSTDNGSTFFRVDFEALISNGFIQIDGVDTTAANLNQFSIIYNAVPGDFNDDGTVDAGDYVVWRANLGNSAAALNSNGSGAATVVPADYDLWRANFGTSGIQETLLTYIGASGVSLGAAVPEPSSFGLLLTMLGVTLLRRKVVR